MLAQYDVCFSDLVAELPFTLMHPKPEDDPDNQRPGSAAGRPPSSLPPDNTSQDTALDANLIQLDAWVLAPSVGCLVFLISYIRAREY